MSPKHRKEPEDFNGEKCEGEDMRRARQSTGQHRTRHERGIRRERCGEFRSGIGSVVKGEDIQSDKPKGHGPDTVGGGGAREGFEDWGEAEEGTVDEDGGFGGGEEGGGAGRPGSGGGVVGGHEGRVVRGEGVRGRVRVRGSRGGSAGVGAGV